MRYELYSLICGKCGERNSPARPSCIKCGGPVRQQRRCSSCQTENPPNAYVCIHCYRVLQTKPQTGFLHWRIPWSFSFLVLAMCLGWFVYELGKNWVEGLEAEVAYRTQTDQYSNFVKNRSHKKEPGSVDAEL